MEAVLSHLNTVHAAVQRRLALLGSASCAPQEEGEVLEGCSFIEHLEQRVEHVAAVRKRIAKQLARLTPGAEQVRVQRREAASRFYTALEQMSTGEIEDIQQVRPYAPTICSYHMLPPPLPPPLPP